MDKNQTSRKIFIVGDVHGCFEEFLSLLEKINYDKSKHRLILLGDIINRGPYSFKMLEWVYKESVDIVRGNNEQLLLEAIEHGVFAGSVIQDLIEEMAGDEKKWADWINTWPLWIEEKDFIAVHAGLVPDQQLKETDPTDLMCIRTWTGKYASSNHRGSPWHDFYNGKKLVVYGHWARQGLKIKENSIGLDSGCVYGNQLSGMWLAEKQIIQVPAKKNYLAFS